MVLLTDIIVSVRLPKSLLKELKILVKEQHFLDLSEQVRSIVRKKWMEYTKPELYELKQLRKEIGSAVKIRAKKRIQTQVNKELDEIRKKLVDEDLLNEK